MKRIYLIAFACMLMIGCSRCGKTQSLWINESPFRHTLPGAINPAYVMIVTGQSNAASYGVGSNASAGFTSTVNGTKHFDSVSQTFLSYVSSNGFHTGFETQTGGLQFPIRGDTIFMIRVAVNSTPISAWLSPDGALWVNLKRNIDSAFSKLRARGKTPVVLSTIWLQGESDILANVTQNYYETALSNFLDNYMALDAVLLNKQFVMVKIRSDQIFTPNDEAIVNTSFDHLVTARNYCKTIDPVTIGAFYIDQVHYTLAGYMLIANYWNTLINSQ